MKIILLDTVGPVYDMSKCLGGAAVAPVVMVDELLGRGHDVTIMRQDPEHEVWCDALVVNRYSPIPQNVIHARKTVVWAHEFADPRHDIHRGSTFVCVSHHQAEGFRRLSPAARIHVIPPMLGRHVVRTNLRIPLSDVWLYASAEDKGLEDSLAAWEREKPSPDAVLAVMTRDYDDQDKVRRMCAGKAAVLVPSSPQGVVDTMSMCTGLWYHERAAEAFPVTVAIARELGLEIIHRHIGHERCGFDEAMTADMRPETVCKQWEEVLSNG